MLGRDRRRPWLSHDLGASNRFSVKRARGGSGLHNEIEQASVHDGLANGSGAGAPPWLLPVLLLLADPRFCTEVGHPSREIE